MVESAPGVCHVLRERPGHQRRDLQYTATPPELSQQLEEIVLNRLRVLAYVQ